MFDFLIINQNFIKYYGLKTAAVLVVLINNNFNIDRKFLHKALRLSLLEVDDSLRQLKERGVIDLEGDFIVPVKDVNNLLEILLTQDKRVFTTAKELFGTSSLKVIHDKYLKLSPHKRKELSGFGVD